MVNTKNKTLKIERKEVLDSQFKDGLSIHVCADLYQRLFQKIIQVLNKYGMLFEIQPQGYSNVEIEIRCNLRFFFIMTF